MVIAAVQECLAVSSYLGTKLKISRKNSSGTYSPWTYLLYSPKLLNNMAKDKYSKQEQAFLLRIGQNIRAIREEQGLSQEALALKAGLDRSYVGGVERGERNISAINLFKLLISINVNLSDFFKKV